MTGGFTDYPMGNDVYVVTFKANAYTDRQTVAMFLHYRCAELTAETGNDAFVILQSEAADSAFRWTSPGQSTTTSTGTASGLGGHVHGNTTSTTTIVPPQTHSFVKPGLSAVIRVFKSPGPQGAFHAREVMKMLGPRVGAQPRP